MPSEIKGHRTILCGRMRKIEPVRLLSALPIAAACLGFIAIAVWLTTGVATPLALRVPGTDAAPETVAGQGNNPVLAGKVISADGKPSNLPGSWPSFRGAKVDNISDDPTTLSRTWSSSGPKQLWAVDVGEGYAGAAISRGRVYVMDYDQVKKQDALRCLSLADAKEIWRFAYDNAVKRNHGMSRTVPVVTDKFVIAIGPKCHVICLDALTGELRWTIDLVEKFGTTVPPWYAGQCPIVDGDKLILAPAGTNVLMTAVSLGTGEKIWETHNPRGWQMTHSSVMPMEYAGKRMLIYSGSHGVAGVAAEDGTLLWQTTEWKISIATIASPLVLDDGKIFLSGGYNAGSAILQLRSEGEKIVPRIVTRIPAQVFGSTQHTPIFYNQHIFGVRPDGQFACLDTIGKVVWTSGTQHQFGLGPSVVANGLAYVMNDSGKLTLLEASTERFQLLAEAQVLEGRESWGPFALAGNRLIARDFTKMVCLDVGTN